MSTQFAEPGDIERPTNDTQRNQSHSSLWYSLALRISNSTVQRTLQNYLRYYRYKIQFTGHLKDQDKMARHLVCWRNPRYWRRYQVCWQYLMRLIFTTADTSPDILFGTGLKSNFYSCINKNWNSSTLNPALVRWGLTDPKDFNWL
jgi:hypothetical protein